SWYITAPTNCTMNRKRYERISPPRSGWVRAGRAQPSPGAVPHEERTVSTVSTHSRHRAGDTAETSARDCVTLRRTTLVEHSLTGSAPTRSWTDPLLRPRPGAPPGCQDERAYRSRRGSRITANQHHLCLLDESVYSGVLRRPPTATFTRNDSAVFEDFATPDTPGFPAFTCTGQTSGTDRATHAQLFGPFQFGR